MALHWQERGKSLDVGAELKEPSGGLRGGLVKERGVEKASQDSKYKEASRGLKELLCSHPSSLGRKPLSNHSTESVFPTLFQGWQG